jgi:hypothetical protein
MAGNWLGVGLDVVTNESAVLIRSLRSHSVARRCFGAPCREEAKKARAALRRPSIPVASVGLVEALPAWPLTRRLIHPKAHSPEGSTTGGAERASPTLGYGDSPVGLGNTPLPAGTSTAGTAGICHVRTTSFPR